jgi:hypothetical protein
VHRAALRGAVELEQMTAFECKALACVFWARLSAKVPVLWVFGGVVVRACACFGPVHLASSRVVNQPLFFSSGHPAS